MTALEPDCPVPAGVVELMLVPGVTVFALLELDIENQYHPPMMIRIITITQTIVDVFIRVVR